MRRDGLVIGDSTVDGQDNLSDESELIELHPEDPRGDHPPTITSYGALRLNQSQATGFLQQELQPWIGNEGDIDSIDIIVSHEVASVMEGSEPEEDIPDQYSVEFTYVIHKKAKSSGQPAPLEESVAQPLFRDCSNPRQFRDHENTRTYLLAQLAHRVIALRVGLGETRRDSVDINIKYEDSSGDLKDFSSTALGLRAKYGGTLFPAFGYHISNSD